jgi:uncharacterized protein YecE (DUF72 family)
VLACKASRYITHTKKLRDREQATVRFFDAITALGDKLGLVLFQLPPYWRADACRLADVLEALPADLDAYCYFVRQRRGRSCGARRPAAGRDDR